MAMYCTHLLSSFPCGDIYLCDNSDTGSGCLYRLGKQSPPSKCRPSSFVCFFWKIPCSLRKLRRHSVVQCQGLHTRHSLPGTLSEIFFLQGIQQEACWTSEKKVKQRRRLNSTPPQKRWTSNTRNMYALPPWWEGKKSRFALLYMLTHRGIICVLSLRVEMGLRDW